MKKNNNKGFTLMEMLIVVAIIAILIAIAIPTFTQNLNKAKDAADEANARALYAQLMADAMLEDDGTLSAAPVTDETAKTISFGGTTYKFNTLPTITATATTKGEDIVIKTNPSADGGKSVTFGKGSTTPGGGSGSGSGSCGGEGGGGEGGGEGGGT